MRQDMIKQIISKTKDNNYQKVKSDSWSMARNSKTAFIDVDKLVIGVGNSNKRVKELGIDELLRNAKVQ